jgi:hypothetical protein
MTGEGWEIELGLHLGKAIKSLLSGEVKRLDSEKEGFKITAYAVPGKVGTIVRIDLKPPADLAK